MVGVRSYNLSLQLRQPLPAKHVYKWWMESVPRNQDSSHSESCQPLNTFALSVRNEQPDDLKEKLGDAFCQRLATGIEWP